MSIDEQGRRATEALREHRPPIEIPDAAGVAGIVHRRRVRRRVASLAGAAVLVTSLFVWQVQRPSSHATPVNVGGPGTTISPPPTAPASSAVSNVGPGPAASAYTLPPVPEGIGGKPFVFHNITFQIPGDWQAFEMAGTAYLGSIGSSGPDLMFVRVQAGYSGSIDAVAPTSCVGRSDWNPPATTVVVADTGVRPVGSKTAQYRLWRVHCDAVAGPGSHNSPTPLDQQLRAWLLPVSHILIVEQVPPFSTSAGGAIPDTTLAVVTSAQVR